MYESAINMIVDKIQSQMIRDNEDQLMLQIKQTIGYDIDREELWKALQYDRGQYEKGYKDGQRDAMNNFYDEILESRFSKCLTCNKNIEKDDPYIIAYKNGIPVYFCREHFDNAKEYLDYFQEFVEGDNND